MAKDKKNVTNAMRLLNASKIKYETEIGRAHV